MIARPRRRILTLYWLYNCPLLCFASDEEVDRYRHRLSSIVINGINKRRTQLIRKVRGIGIARGSESRDPQSRTLNTLNRHRSHTHERIIRPCQKKVRIHTVVQYTYGFNEGFFWLGISRLEKVCGINNPNTTSSYTRYGISGGMAASRGSPPPVMPLTSLHPYGPIR